MAQKLDNLPRFHPKTRAEWRRWLMKNHLTSEGVWLVTFKKETGEARVGYDDAVCELLCFGWVDSRPAKLDARRSMLLCTPRKPASRWSKPNKQRVARMTEAGLMAPRGLALVALAKKNGGWSALDAAEALLEPPELTRLLDRTKAARRHWDAFPRSVKRGILEWITSAKRAETRTNRITQTAALAANNVRANQWSKAAPIEV